MLVVVVVVPVLVVAEVGDWEGVGLRVKRRWMRAGSMMGLGLGGGVGVLGDGGCGGPGGGGARAGRGGGRALFDEREGEYNRDQGRQERGPASVPPPPKKVDLKKEDFPALPSSAAAPKKVDTAWVPKPGAMDYPISSPIGKWDEEVAATLDANENPS